MQGDPFCALVHQHHFVDDNPILQDLAHQMNDHFFHFRRKAAQKLDIVLHPYEELFIELIEQSVGKPISKLDFGILVKPLIEEISYRIGGYNLEQSREYYRQVIEREKGVSWICLREESAEFLREFDVSIISGF